MTERYRMETINDIMLPFIVDNESAKKNGKTTSYHTYETHKKEKCLELVDLLNDYHNNDQFNRRLILAYKSIIDDIDNEIRLNGTISKERFWEIKDYWATKMFNGEI